MTFAEQTLVRITQKIRHEFSGGGGIARGIFVENEDGGAEGAIFSSAAARRAFQLFCLNAEPRGKSITQGNGYGKGLRFIVKLGLVFLSYLHLKNVRLAFAGKPERRFYFPCHAFPAGGADMVGGIVFVFSSAKFFM